MIKDKGLEYLLDLDGEIWGQEHGCWTKINARKLKAPTDECPHGISYCLTLHDRYGKRLLGFDNSHPIKTRKRGKFIGRSVIYDHKHMDSIDKGTPYVFDTAEQLIKDFFKEVDKILKKLE